MWSRVAVKHNFLYPSLTGNKQHRLYEQPYNRRTPVSPFQPTKYIFQSCDKYAEGFRDKIGSRWSWYYRLFVLVRTS